MMMFLLRGEGRGEERTVGGGVGGGRWMRFGGWGFPGAHPENPNQHRSDRLAGNRVSCRVVDKVACEWRWIWDLHFDLAVVSVSV